MEAPDQVCNMPSIKSRDQGDAEYALHLVLLAGSSYFLCRWWDWRETKAVRGMCEWITRHSASCRKSHAVNVDESQWPAIKLTVACDKGGTQDTSLL